MLKEIIDDIDKIDEDVLGLLESEDTDILITNIYKVSDKIRELKTKITYLLEEKEDDWKFCL